MAKVTFSSLKLKVKDDIKTIKIGEKEIEVKQYLPAKEKNELLEISLQRAVQGTVFNSFLADVYFHTYLIMEYTNITFTDTQREDLLKLYDILETNDIINTVVAAIPEDEYKYLMNEFEAMCNKFAKYLVSAKCIADDILQYAPKQQAEMTEELKNFDLNKLQNVLGIAEGMNLI